MCWLLQSIARIPAIHWHIAYALLFAVVVFVVAIALPDLALPPHKTRTTRLSPLALLVRQSLHHLVLPAPALALIQVRALE